jgi:hypothetical protein
MESNSKPSDRDHVIFAAISSSDLAAFRIICAHRQRTTEFLAGQIIHDWIQANPPSNTKSSVPKEDPSHAG